MKTIRLVEEPSLSALAHKDILRVGRIMYEESYDGDWIEEDIASSMATWGQSNCIAISAINWDNDLCGLGSFYLSYDPFFKNVIATELFITVFPEYRKSSIYLRILKRMLKCATEAKATKFFIGSVNKDLKQRARYCKMLEHLGFTQYSTNYQRRLFPFPE